jgi:hypothetical protein
MRVEHVTVNEGGQAIVGNVFHGGRGPSEKKNQPHEAGICVSKSRPLLGHLKTDKGAVRGSRGTRLDRVPLPRSARRSAEGGSQLFIQTRAPYSRNESRAPLGFRSSPAITEGNSHH